MRTLNEVNEHLKQPLDVGRVKKRQGGGGNSLSYIETHDAITALNRIFGYDAWSFELLGFESIPTPKGFAYRQTVSLTVIIEGRAVTRQDVGIGLASNGNSDQIEKGMKEAASDGLKRAARTFGEQFGNSLYEKDAPEHRGEQRVRLATSEQLTECEALRVQAVGVGFLVKGVAPKPQREGAEEKAVTGRIAAYRTYIQEHGDKGAPVDDSEAVPDRFSAIDQKAQAFKAYGDFVAICEARGLKWGSDGDVVSFENAATDKASFPVVVDEFGENEWAEWAATTRDEAIRW